MLCQPASRTAGGGGGSEGGKAELHPSSTGEQGHWELATEPALVASLAFRTGLSDTGAEPHTGRELTGCLPDKMELRCLCVEELPRHAFFNPVTLAEAKHAQTAQNTKGTGP